MINSEIPKECDNKGIIFIDRKPDIFEHVLEFLRDEQQISVIRKLDDAKITSIQIDSKYYMIDTLLDYLGKTNNINSPERRDCENKYKTKELNTICSKNDMIKLINCYCYNNKYDDNQKQQFDELFKIFEEKGANNYFILPYIFQYIDAYVDMYIFS